MKGFILTSNDKTPTTIEYVGIWTLLDILMKKIDKEEAIERIKHLIFEVDYDDGNEETS